MSISSDIVVLVFVYMCSSSSLSYILFLDYKVLAALLYKYISNGFL